MVTTDMLKGSVITSRVRLARNFADMPFVIKDPTFANEIIKKVYSATSKCDDFSLLYIKNLSKIKLESLKEKYLISRVLAENSLGAVMISADEKTSVMIHEEDIIRAQCFMSGLKLTDCYNQLKDVDYQLEKHFDIAYSDRFGYLTACPTNLGTGMRASVIMFLPAISEAGEIDALFKEVTRLGLTIRGVYGEGSCAEGYMYQISNEVTLGVSESEIIASVEDTLNIICEAEFDRMKKVFCKDELKTMDTAKKSYGILTNAVMLGYSEFLEHISNVKIGAMLGLIDISSIEALDRLIVSVRPANLCEHYKKSLSAKERDLFRAEYTKQQLTKLKEV